MNYADWIGWGIITLTALIMVWIGVYQVRKKDAPVGFYNMIDPPKKSEISDILQWNKKHGRIWILYGSCIEAGFWLAYLMPNEAAEMFFLMGGCVIPLPFMIWRHHVLEKKYRIL